MSQWNERTIHDILSAAIDKPNSTQFTLNQSPLKQARFHYDGGCLNASMICSWTVCTSLQQLINISCQIWSVKTIREVFSRLPFKSSFADLLICSIVFFFLHALHSHLAMLLPEGYCRNAIWTIAVLDIFLHTAWHKNYVKVLLLNFALASFLASQNSPAFMFRVTYPGIPMTKI